MAQLGVSEYETQARCILVIWGLSLYGWMFGLCTGHYTWRFTIYTANPCSVRRAGKEGRDSVLCHSPGTPEEIPFLQKLTQFTGLTGLLELEPVNTQGTLPGSWWQPVLWEAPKFHIPSVFRSSHSVPPSRQQTWSVAFSEGPGERQGVHPIGSLDLWRGGMSTSRLQKAQLGKDEWWWRHVSQ